MKTHGHVGESGGMHVHGAAVLLHYALKFHGQVKVFPQQIYENTWSGQSLPPADL